MRTIEFAGSLLCTLLLMASACSSAPEPADGQTQDHSTDETVQKVDGDTSVEDFDVQAFLAEQDERVLSIMCERPFECFDELDEREVPVGYTLEDCRAEFAMTDLEIEFLAGRTTEELKGCAEADQAVTDCLQEARCDDLLDLVLGELGPEDEPVCAAEIEVQYEACRFFHDFADAGEQP